MNDNDVSLSIKLAIHPQATVRPRGLSIAVKNVGTAGKVLEQTSATQQCPFFVSKSKSILKSIKEKREDNL